MCLIIASQNGSFTKDSIVWDGFHDNKDSWGIMRSNGTRLLISKGFTWKSFHAEYSKLKGDPYVIHFRWATHGDVNTANCHPFRITDDLYMAHNGIISTPIEYPNMSDSWHYASDLARWGLNSENIRCEENILTIESEIGLGNKLAFLTSSGELYIANKKAGITMGDIWLSNGHSIWPEYEEEQCFNECELCTAYDWLSKVRLDDYISMELCESCARWAVKNK